MIDRRFLFSPFVTSRVHVYIVPIHRPSIIHTIHRVVAINVSHRLLDSRTLYSARSVCVETKKKEDGSPIRSFARTQCRCIFFPVKENVLFYISAHPSTVLSGEWRMPSLIVGIVYLPNVCFLESDFERKLN